MQTEHHTTLQRMQQQLDRLRQGQLNLSGYLDEARQQDALMRALPPAFGEVWRNLLDRLESASLFSEESCSFSQKDLLDSLQLWLDKAGQRLA
ncbi:hypothetical protein [Hydrogenophaga aquatica]